MQPILMRGERSTGKLSTGDMLAWSLVHGLSELPIADHFKGTLPEGD